MHCGSKWVHVCQRSNQSQQTDNDGGRGSGKCVWKVHEHKQTQTPSVSFFLQSDFLDFYVSYLKELPDCLSVVTMLASSSMKSSSFLEVTQNELT